MEAPRTRNPRGQGERLRTALIDAAIEVLNEVQDVSALSVRAVTARAGVSPTALYLHFADKDELVGAVKERCFAELRRYLLAAETAAAQDAREQATAMCLAYLQFSSDLPGYYRVLFHIVRPSLGPSADEEEAREVAAGERFVNWPSQAAEAFGDLVRAVGRCLPDDRDPFETATLVWAALHGLAGLRRMHRFPFPPVERLVELLLDAHLGSA